jgi:hypothetical protein
LVAVKHGGIRPIALVLEEAVMAIGSRFLRDFFASITRIVATDPDLPIGVRGHVAVFGTLVFSVDPHSRPPAYVLWEQITRF